MPEQRRPPDGWKPAATTLRRVVPVAQKRYASELTVALSFLEIHEGGNGLLRFLMRQDRPTRRRALELPRLELCVRDGSGRPLDTVEDSSGSSMGPSYATLASRASLLVFGLPDSDDVEVEVARVANVEMEDPRAMGEEGVSWEGPWAFRFRV